MDQKKPSGPPPGAAGQKPPDIREIMADYDKAVKFFHEMPAEAWEGLGQKTALSIYNEIIETIPVYRDFLESHGFEPRKLDSVEQFQQIPIIDKYNYIQAYDFNDVNPVQAGKNLYSFSLSSGTVDEPTIWPRYYQYEESVLPSVVGMYLRLYWQIDKKSTLFINALALGAWSAGFTMHAGLRPLTQKYNFTYVPIGADVDNIIFTILRLSKYYDQTAIITYTTFMRTILERLEQTKVKIKDLHLKLFIGGEGHTVEWRRYINKLISGDPEDSTSIIDNYASSDTMIAGLSSVVTNLIRDLASKNENFRKDLFGRTDCIPTLFQYNPASSFIEEINEEIVLTTKNATPLVRYNIHDKGGIIKFREMEEILKKYGYDYKELIKERGLGEEYIWQQPLVYLFGRRDDTVIIAGANIFPEQIAPALFNEKVKDIHSFKLSMKYDKRQRQFFYALLELKKGISYNKIQMIKMRKKYHAIIMDRLLRVNSDYMISYKADSKYADIIIEIYNNDEGPFKGDSERIKPQLVIK